MEYSIFPTKASALKWARENLIHGDNPCGTGLLGRFYLTPWHPNSDTCKQWKLTYRKEDLIPLMGEAELDNLLMDAGVDPAAMVARTLKKIEV